MKRLFICIVTLFCGLMLSYAHAQQSYGSYTATATGASTGINQTTGGINYHLLTWTGSGTRTSCTVALDSSVDGVTWTSGGAISGQNCTANGNSTAIAGTFNYVRINVTALTGAGNTVNVVYDGYTVNPSGGGGTTIVKSAQYATADQLSAAGTFATTYTIPSGTLKAGSLIQVWTAGPYNITTGERLEPGVSIGGTTALPATGQFLSTGTGNWNMQSQCVVVGAGATGTAECEGVVSASGTAANAIVAANTTFTINTTTALAVAIPVAGLVSTQGTANLSQLTVVVIP